MNKMTRLMAVTLSWLIASVSIEAMAYEEIDFVPQLDVVHIPDGITLGGVSGAAADKHGNIYVLHRGSRPVLSFDHSGKFLRAWGDDLIGSGHGLNVDSQGNVWVTDTGHHLVFKFSPEGEFLLSLGTPDRPGESESQFDKPTFVTVSANGDIYVADGYGNSRIIVFDRHGKYLRTWGSAGDQPGQFHSPHEIVIDANQRVIVADRDNSRIQVFSPQGKLLDTWTGYTPFGIALTPQNVLFVADGKANAIHQLDSRGHVVRSWGKEGTSAGEFKTPHLLTADSEGNLYVAEVGGRRLQVLVRQKN